MGYHRAASEPAGFPGQVFFPDAARPARRSPVDVPGQLAGPLESSTPPGQTEAAGQDPHEKNRRAQERKEKTVIEHEKACSRKLGQKGRPAEADGMPGPFVFITPQPRMGRNGKIQPPTVLKRVMEASEETRRVRRMLEHIEHTGRGQGSPPQADGFECAAKDVVDSSPAGVPAAVQTRFKKDAPESMPGHHGGYGAVSSSNIPDVSGRRKTPEAPENDAVAMGEPPRVILDGVKDAISVGGVGNRLRQAGGLPDAVAVFDERDAGARGKTMSGQSSSSTQIW